MKTQHSRARLLSIGLEGSDLEPLQQQMPNVPPPWVDASDLLLRAELTVHVQSLQELVSATLKLSPCTPCTPTDTHAARMQVCVFLARHLHTLSLLDDLPEHLAVACVENRPSAVEAAGAGRGWPKFGASLGTNR